MSETQIIKTDTEETPLLTDAQQEQMASRTIHDAELLKAGAAYDNLGRLSVSTVEQDKLHEQYIKKPKVEAFLENTSEGQSIKSLRSANQAAGAYIGTTYLDHTGFYALSGVDKNQKAFEDLVSNATLPVDFDTLELARSGGWESKAQGEKYAHVLQAELASYNTRLAEAATVLADNPDLTIGSEVTVQRTGKPSESDWKFDDITPTGHLRVGKSLPDNEYMYKDVSAAGLIAAQPK